MSTEDLCQDMIYGHIVAITSEAFVNREVWNAGRRPSQYSLHGFIKRIQWNIQHT